MIKESFFFLKRCQDRLKESRDKFLTKFRGSPGHTTEQMVKDLMVEEWKVMCSEDSQLPSIAQPNSSDLLQVWAFCHIKYAHITPIRKRLHWLPVNYRCMFITGLVFTLQVRDMGDNVYSIFF